MSKWMLLLPMLFPIIAGCILAFLKRWETDRRRNGIFMLALSLEVIFSMLVLCAKDVPTLSGAFIEQIPLLFRVDDLSRLFGTLIVVIWWLCGLFSLEYMKHEGGERRFDAFYLIGEGVIFALCLAGNLVTMYLCFECMTLSTMPLVLHEKTKDAVRAARKYMFYSIFGASAALGGIVILAVYAPSITFLAGGVFTAKTFAAHSELYLTAAMVMIFGFCGKAGMFPLHGWLPTAHPQAPAPASAVMSGVITKMGVLAVMRVVFYIFGTSMLRGTWVQVVWMSLAVITIFMGSMMAWKEPLMKRRFAYSTVSQVSYILLGLATMTEAGMLGGCLHIVFHAAAKVTLFLMSGAVIYYTGRKRVEELSGIGRAMPIVIGTYTIASFALVGIPPFTGFVSKEWLAHGAMESGISILWVLAPIVLLASAILTAVYLLPISIRGFVETWQNGKTPIVVSKCMWIPMVCLAVVCVILGILPNGLISWLRQLIVTLV